MKPNLFKQVRTILVLVATSVLLAGCSKPAERPPAPKVKSPQPPAIQPARPPLPDHGAAPVQSAAPAPGPLSLGEEPSPEKIAATYLAVPDLGGRVELISELSNTEPAAAAVAAFHKLFRQESDAELKQAMLDALQDIDGAPAGKLDLLREAVQGSQPSAVRQSAIEALTALGGPAAVKVLVPLLSDLDDNVREAAQDAVDTLQAKQ